MKFLLTLILGIPLTFIMVMGTWSIVKLLSLVFGPVVWTVFVICIVVVLVVAVLSALSN